ncbi:glycosyl hydrolase family 28 protein [Paenibacillus sp. S150]|uniref:glycosyl hydrolase family 28 protein n=1 Tax=Paenibacillus sp. S150 TaxID=2749826 RepID=UPI001C583132|nr:glycosyl hydrolase family 28 protein [Paenibacillus sp. S150]MBW4080001.1 hypothetical protein [Paenibacillus sp. S150]
MQEAMKDLVVYSAPDGLKGNPDFSVRVRAIGGEWQTIFNYNVKVDMHHVRNASMVTFDCAGPVELEIIKLEGLVQEVAIRPIACGLKCEYEGNKIKLQLDGPRQLSLEINGDRFHNLHILANAVEQEIPDPSRSDVLWLKAGMHNTAELIDLLYAVSKNGDSKYIYFDSGIHRFDTDRLEIPSFTNVYTAGGALIIGGFICNQVEEVCIRGRGILFMEDFVKTTYYRGVEINYSRNISVEGITVIDPPHYTILLGQSTDIQIRNIKSFSTRGWCDGIDMMACSNVSIDGVFLRTSDDSIAIYASRGEFRGNTRNISVQNSILWADVAHPVNIGTHGGYEGEGDVIENVIINEIDILEHHEPQPDYWGCLAINAGDNNSVQNVTFENIRIEPFELGELFNVRVLQNPKYNPAPGKQIRKILFKNISYTGSCANRSHIEGYDETRKVEGVIFDNVLINGRHFDFMQDVLIGPHVTEVKMQKSKV